MTLRSPARVWLREFMPAPLLRPIEAVAHRRPSYRQYLARQEESRVRREQLDDEVLALVGDSTVLAGPLAGTILTRAASWGQDFSARLVGSYEKELHPIIEQMVSDHTPLVVDVGCADGYYVAGLGRMASGAELVGYDIDPDALTVTAALAEMNGVADRLRLRAACRSRDLESLPAGAVVLVDCEGAERWLITREVVATNPGGNFIIECHESVVPGITEHIVGLFDGRRVERVPQQPRTAADAPSLPPDLAELVTCELRSPKDGWVVVFGDSTATRR